MKKKTILSIGGFVLMVVCMFFVFTSLIKPIRIIGDSMYPTLHNGDFGVMSGINNNADNIKRFEVVIIDCKQLDRMIVKRVIGLPGETIKYSDDKLYVNGVYQEETFLDKDYIEESLNARNQTLFTSDFEVTVNEGEVFVLGDNRLNSTDSRVLGSFSFDSIEGHNGLVLFPLNNTKWVD